MALKKQTIKKLLDNREFGELFIQLGWNWPETETPYPVKLGDALYELKPVANKKGFIAYHCPSIPDATTRSKIESKLSRDVREHIIIFTDAETNRQRWQWVRRAKGQPLSRREHEYKLNQPMLLIEKIGYLEVPIEEEEGIDLIDVYDKVKTAFDIDKVTKKFYDRFKKEHDAFLGFIDGVKDLGDKKWYASVMLNRLMFIYFIQKKGFLDGDTDYLKNRLAKVQSIKGRDKFHTFYRYFLLTLCHEVLAKKDRDLDKELAALIGKVPYLNGGIFQPHEIEEKYGDAIEIPDDAFEKVFAFFDQYEWHLDNRPNAAENEINPDVLGYIFEKYINQKEKGAYYTKEDITEYISKNTIISCLFDKAQKSCKIAFEGEASIWNLLKDDPDRYIYPAVRHGVTYDVHRDCEIDDPVPYPEDISVGLDTSKPNLLERRKQWNAQTPPEAGLPTEIWRETVARRQRYEEVRGKLVNGEVKSINELITLNLDIRQFAQDVIERCESPDLLNAFWVAIAGYIPKSGSNKKAVAGITVLDPTCGSGAFLFAALNILEPLYEACLDRMAGFLDEWGEHPKHKNYAGFFTYICEEIDKHPSHKYFIYKSIIIHNLYGVDIMKEAVEICKLRLFLKLVAQVEDGAKIEPLPDIDFNIKAGNTLVGFATEEQMKAFFDRDRDDQMLLQFDNRLGEVKQAAEEVDACYKLFRQSQFDNDASLNDSKSRLSSKLKILNDRLNQYLAEDYGVDLRKKKNYQKFLETHQAFHWFVEFYGIMKAGGFDAIIGNPPYVQNSEVKEYGFKGYSCKKCGNLYALVMERCLQIAKYSAEQGFIVPVSSISTDGYIALQEILETRSVHYSSFDDRPSRLFDGLQHIRLTIHLIHGKKPSSLDFYSTNYNKWYSDERDYLFARMKYSLRACPSFDGSWGKLSDDIEHTIFKKIESSIKASMRYVRRSNFKFYCSRKIGYFLQILQFMPRVRDGSGAIREPSEFKSIYTNSVAEAKAISSSLNSNLFYWYLTLFSDCRHVNKREIDAFPVGWINSEIANAQIAELVLLGDKLMSDLKANSEERYMKFKHDSLSVQCIFPKKSKTIIDEIDTVLATHYGFTEEELDYIINYDIKYRMGKDLQKSGEAVE